MKLWNDIINRASLGSSKLPLKSTDLPSDITKDYDLGDTDELEANFLNYSSLIYQFRQSGAQPLNLKVLSVSPSAEEHLQTCSSHANNILKTVIDEEVPQFIELWLRLCVSKQNVAHAEMIPYLLELGQKKKELRKFVAAAAGKRGEWLATLNPQWSFSSVKEDSKTVWETGTFDERKELILNFRNSEPDKAIELLQSTWASEGANEKTAFLEILKVNLSAQDLNWLTNLKEKGQKVNNAIVELMKSIPTSAISQEYQEVLKNAISFKSGKALLGMINKTTLNVDESVTIPDSIFKTGIDKLSSDKNVTDNQFIISQLLSIVPPSFLNEHLKTESKAIVEYFKKVKDGFYIQALAIASIRHKDVQWIKILLDECGDAFTGATLVMLLNLLPETDKNTYALKFIKEKPGEITQMMIHSVNEWNVELAKEILKYTAGEIYQFNRSFYKPAAVLIPVSLIDSLESFTPSEEQKKVYWKNQSDELARLLAIKKQILQSFNT